MRKPGDLITKDPNSDEPQGFDWTSWLAELGATVEIQTSTWIITGPDAVLTKHDESRVDVAGLKLKTQLYLAAGTPGGLYRVANRVVTSSSPPATDDRSFFVRVKDR